MMMEIPESHTIARQLESIVKGKVVADVSAAASPHKFAFYFGSPESYRGLLMGKTLGRTKAHAGQVEMEADEVRLLFADGVNIRYCAEQKNLPRKHQLLLEFEDGSALVCTIQMYGGMWAFREGENENPYYLATKEKPSPLSDDFDESYFDALFASNKPSLSAKAFLAAEQRIPGLGNGVLQDILFEAGINPKSKISMLSDGQRGLLYGSLKRNLASMARQGGRDTEKDLFGEEGGYTTRLSARTFGKPCPTCGGEIVRQAYMGGNVYYCPRCQPVQS